MYKMVFLSPGCANRPLPASHAQEQVIRIQQVDRDVPQDTFQAEA